ncbi:hypothetical protein KUU40_08095 [Pseudomonas aeruginosa]|nr:hypothetical protein [Pseudomonas aeruginosa]MBV6112954.1 hypothetical protein [Pseudomonas aeruginosa]
MTASKIQMDQIRSTSATVTGENIRAGSQKKSSLSPAEGLQGASPDATCTCPSGNGSLRHPCPAHPAVEQAGGDERAVDGKPRATKCPDCGEGDLMPGDLCACGYETDPAAGYACSECDGSGDGYVGEVCRECDGSGWFVTPEQARAALAQPSPASDLDPLNLAPHAEAFNEAPAEALKPEPAEADRPEVAEVAFVLRNIGAMDAEDIDGDNVDLRFEDAEGRDTGCDVSIVEYAEKAADLFEQHDRIVGELRAVIAQLRQHKNDYMDSGQQTYRALQNEIREREAEIARLDGLVSGRTAERDAALAEVERLRESKGDPSGSFDRCMKMMYERDENAKRLDAALARVAELEKQEPVAHLRASDLERLNQPGIAGSAGSLWNGPREGFVPLYAAPVAQAQHSVPEVSGIGRDFAYPRSVVLYLRTEPTDDDLRAIHDGLRSLAAAPGKEGV